MLRDRQFNRHEKDNKNFQVWLNTGLIGRYFLQLKVLVRSNNYSAFAIPEHSSCEINFDEIRLANFH